MCGVKPSLGSRSAVTRFFDVLACYNRVLGHGIECPLPPEQAGVLQVLGGILDADLVRLWVQYSGEVRLRYALRAVSTQELMIAAEASLQRILVHTSIGSARFDV